MDWISIIGFAAIGQCILLATKYIIGRSSQQQRLLIALFLTLSIYHLHEVFVHSRLIIQFPFLFGWGPIFPLLIGPLLYLYVRSILDIHFKLGRKDLLHAIPFLIALWSRKDLILSSSEEKSERLQIVFQLVPEANASIIQNFDLDNLTHFFLWHSLPMIYFALIVVTIIKAKERIYSTKKLANWLKILSFGLFIYFLGDYLIEILMPVSFVMSKLDILIPLFSFYLFGLCLLVITHNSSNYMLNAIAADTMSKLEIKKYFKSLEYLMQEKKPYLNSQLQLADLANEVGLQGRELSLVIKKCSGLSYSDYINKFRIEYAKKLIQNPVYRTYTISAIGEESGFKSKDVFYRSFKKLNGVTPKVFLDQLESPKT